MRLLKITCLVSAGVVVEDLGVRLPGKGSSQLVHADSAGRSKDLPRMAGLVRVDAVPEARPMPFWPFVKAPAPPALPALPESPGSGVQAKLEELGRVQKEILDLLRAGSLPAQAQALAILSPPDLVQTPDPGPMFIPSQIVPRVQGIHVKAKEEAIEKEDMDSSLEALRKARRGR